MAAYMSSPCHIELILSEKEEPVKKEVVVCISFVTSLVSSASKIVLRWFFFFSKFFKKGVQSF